MTTRFDHTAPWGTEILDGGARFRLWAPAQDKISLLGENGATVPMTKTDGDRFEVTTDAVPVGGGYRFLLADGMPVPDPAARAQMADVHGPSRLVDPKAFEWRCTDWKGRPWEQAVLYELHTGAFDALQLTANLADAPAAWPLLAAGTPFFTHSRDLDPSQDVLPPWSVIAATIDQE